MEDGMWPRPLAAAFELGALREYLRKHGDKIKSELNLPESRTNSVDDVLQAVGACFDECIDQWFRDLAEAKYRRWLQEGGKTDA